MKFKDLLKNYDPEAEIGILIVVNKNVRIFIIKKTINIVLILFSIIMTLKIISQWVF